MKGFSKRQAVLTGADCFILNLSRMMKIRGQNGLIGQTQLDLDGKPDIPRLKETAQRFSDSHPLLNAHVGRDIFTLVPFWREDRGSRRTLNLNLWAEDGVAIEADTSVQRIATAHGLAEELLNKPLEENSGVRNLRLDLVFLRGGGSVLFFTWNHILFDGKGAELLVEKFRQAGNGKTIGQIPSKASKLPSLIDQLHQLQPAKERFFELIGHKYFSLLGKASGKCRFHYKLLKFDQETTKKIQARAARLCGIFSVSFYLACAARAHRHAFRIRGIDPSHYVNSIPVQVRSKAERQDPFQNRVSVLFFLLEKENLNTMELAVEAAQRQFEDMTRKELGSSFEALLRLMRILPSCLYLKFLGAQFSGTIATFFHSFTGSFPFDDATICGVRILDARHVPSVSAPPGSGLFFSESHGCLTAVFSWREGALTEAEVDLVLGQVKNDLLGIG